MKISPAKQINRNTHHAWSIVISVVLFATLMALRYELSSIWARAIVAGCAFAVLVWGLLASRRAKS